MRVIHFFVSGDSMTSIFAELNVKGSEQFCEVRDWIRREKVHHVILRGIERGSIVRDDTDRKTFVDRITFYMNGFVVEQPCRLQLNPSIWLFLWKALSTTGAVRIFSGRRIGCCDRVEGW